MSRNCKRGNRNGEFVEFEEFRIYLVYILNGQFQKISIPIPRTAFRISEGEGGFFELEFRRNGGYLRLEIRRHGGISQGGFLE